MRFAPSPNVAVRVKVNVPGEMKITSRAPRGGTHSIMRGPPSLWGTEERLRDLFGDQIATLMVARRTFSFRYRSAQHWLDTFRTYYGPVEKTFGALEPERQDALANDLIDLLQRFDIGAGAGLVVPSDYLEVVAMRS